MVTRIGVAIKVSNHVHVLTQSQTLKFHSPVSPDPLSASLARVPKVTPPLKNPRSANGLLFFDYTAL